MDNPSGYSSGTELGVFLRAMWRRRWGIVAGTVGAMLVGLVAFLVLPEQYESKARLVIAEFHFQESLTGDDGRETFAALVSSRETYAELVSSPTIARRIVDEQGLAASLELTPDDLLVNVTVELIPNTALLELTVELPDAQIAFDVARAFAEQAAALSRSINDADRQRAAAVVTAQLEEADAELDRLEAQIAELQKGVAESTPRLVRLESQFETALAIRADTAKRLNSSQITVASQIAELIVVDEPVMPTGPSSPGGMIMLAGAGFLGLVLSLLIAGMAAGMESTAGEGSG